MTTREAVLLRYRMHNTAQGVTRRTVANLARTLGLSETETIHRALAEYARTHLPRYEADDGPLNAKQRTAIARAVRARHGKARVIETLFASAARPIPERRRARKSVRAASRTG